MSIKSMAKTCMVLMLLVWGGFYCVSNQGASGVDPFSGGTSTGNGAMLAGTLYQAGGKKPARNASVVLRPRDFLAEISKLSKRRSVDTPFVRRTSANDSGGYCFISVPKGRYCLEAIDSCGGDRLLMEVDSSAFKSEIVELGADTLEAGAEIWGKLLSGYASAGTYVRVYGLDVVEKVGPDSTFNLNGLPAGNLRIDISVSIRNAPAFDTAVSVPVAAGTDTLLSLAITVPNASTGTSITFQRTVSDTTFFPEAFQQTSDGGYVFTGAWLSSTTPPSSDYVFLMKTDASAGMAWRKVFGSASLPGERVLPNPYCVGHAVRQTSDGGYIVAGVGVIDDTWKNVFLMKTDAAGMVVWQKSFPDTLGVPWVKFLRQTPDGGYIVGINDGCDKHEWMFCLIKTDAAGTIEWKRPGDGFGYAQCVEQTSDNGCIIAGRAPLRGISGGDFPLIKTNAAGSIEWIKPIGDSLGNEANSVRQTKDGGYIMSGFTNGCLSVMKTDVGGTVEWTKKMVNDTFQLYNVSCALQTGDGGYVVAGTTITEAGSCSMFLTRLDSVQASASGSRLETTWTRYWGAGPAWTVTSMEPASDGGYLIFSSRMPLSGGLTAVILTKTNADGIVE